MTGDRTIENKEKRRVALSSVFAGLLLTHGWMTALIVARIHYQALRLWAKGASFHRKPSPPAAPVSVGSREPQ